MMRFDRQVVLCDAIRDTLAAPDFPDHWLAYEALARLKLPGLHYLQILRLLHTLLKPKRYVEIGVRYGDSLAQASQETACVAIDPEPHPDLLAQGRPNTIFALCISDTFFESEERRELARGFDLAFIDGDHSFEQVRKDFIKLEALAGPHSIICLHDVIPMDARTATPKPETSFHTGDVWRLMAQIVGERTDLVALTVACPPTGLGIVGRFGAMPTEIPIWDQPRDFPSDWHQQVKLLNIVSNDPLVFLPALKGKP